MSSTSAGTNAATGQAGGKIILFGEHAVVHGSLALSMGLNRGVRVTATDHGGPLVLRVPQWQRTVTVGDGSREGEALGQIAHALQIDPAGAVLEADIQIPVRAGLGSSAALAGATAQALAALRSLSIDSEALFNAVQASEKVFHGNPSGLDARTSLGGGLLTFSRAEGSKSLNLKPPEIAVFYSGHPGDTGATVAQFAKRLHENEGRERLDRISELTGLGVRALESDDLSMLGKLMYENHQHLDWFGVSSPSLNHIVEIAHKHGALGAKLTGGGGGGCAIVLPKIGDTALLQLISDAGYSRVAL